APGCAGDGGALPGLASLARPRPPSSTLFPYPTLFRSLDDAALPAGIESRIEMLKGTAAAGAEVAARRGGAMRPRLQQLETGGAEDRKSTRLNSSHVKISYAVFCLKKKTDDRADRRRHR